MELSGAALWVMEQGHSKAGSTGNLGMKGAWRDWEVGRVGLRGRALNASPHASGLEP